MPRFSGQRLSEFAVEAAYTDPGDGGGARLVAFTMCQQALQILYFLRSQIGPGTGWRRRWCQRLANAAFQDAVVDNVALGKHQGPFQHVA